MYTLTELQLAILQVLWSGGEATVVEVQQALAPERKLALTTVATLLTRLEKRGLATHRTEGRQYVYRAAVTEQQVQDSVVEEFRGLAGELFRGRVAELVSHLLAVEEVEPEELARVKALIERKEREQQGGGA